MLKVRMTVVDPARAGATADVLVSAAPGTALAAVTPALLAAVGRESPDNACESSLFSARGVPVPGSVRVGSAPLLDGAVLAVRGVGSTSPPVPGLLAVHVVAGPDAGRVISLPPGEHEVGREPGSSVRLDDPDVSRVHAVLRVDTGRTTVRDAGSTHGTHLAGEPIGTDPATLAPGVLLQIGTSRLVLRSPDVTPASLTPDAAGHLLVNRRPHLRAVRSETTVGFPAAPEERPPAKLPWLVMLLPMAVSLVVAAVLRQPMFLLFALTTPALMAGQFLTERRSGRRDKRDRQARFEAETHSAREELDRAVADDADHEEARLPDLALIAGITQVPGCDLWHRPAADPDGLLVRLGRGQAASRVRRSSPPTRAMQQGAEPVVHPDVAIGVDVGAYGVIGICGPDRTALARSLLGQLAALRSPQDLAVEVAGASGAAGEWSWVRWLPHHPSAGGAGPVRMTLVDDARRLRRSPGVGELLTAASRPDPGSRPGPESGSGRELMICLAADVTELPMECRATVELDPPAPPGEPRRAVLRRAGCDPLEFSPDLPGPAWSELIARALAPLRDATPQPGALPACPGLADLIASVEGVRPEDPADLARHWQRDPVNSTARTGPTATIGVGPGGAVRIDLRQDGPHALIGGTTGAGKSELLLSLVTALAVDRGPDEMSFLLVDYKGGAAFQASAGLPHVAGLITDLDPHLAARALASLQAELRRRERLLAAAGAFDLDGYRAAGARMARLVVVVDEFRVLAEELPDFISGLVRIAAVGRSLGVHLVLATQRPAGVVSPEIRANTALRIALRVRDAADSHDLIETPAAAAIPAGAPGRAIARIDSGLLTFQVASVLAPRERPRPPSVRPLDGEPEPETAPRTQEPAALERIVAAARAAADLAGLAPVARPWLPPLPHRLPLRGVLERADPVRPGSPVAFLGLADLPESQHQEPAAWTTAAGHLGILGGPRSGRTTALLTIAHGLAARYTADEVHLYAVDAGSGLEAIARLPHCGALVPAADADRCARLLARLRELIDGRRSPCPVVVLVDGWESLSARWAGIDHGILVDQLTAVLRDGARHGIHLAVTGGRSLLAGQVSSLLSERLVLRFADPTDAVLAGVRNLGDQPPGRGVLVRSGDPEGCEIQVAAADFAIAPESRGAGGPWLLRQLPVQVVYETLPAPAVEGLQVPLGVGGDAAEPVFLDLDRPGVALIHGSPGSGRTTALAVIEAGVRARGVRVVRPVGGDPAGCRGELAADPDAVVLLDDVSRLTDPGLEQALIERARSRPDRPRIVVVAGPGEVLNAFRGLAAEARASRHGLALGSLSAADTGVLGLGPMVRPAGPPGRGRLVDGAVTVPVQIAGRPQPSGATDQTSADQTAADQTAADQTWAGSTWSPAVSVERQSEQTVASWV